MRTLTFVFLLLSLFSYSCNKSKADSPPADLKVDATVAPNKSGNVSFVVSATSATSYEFDFGDGSIHAINETGNTTYKYFGSGTYNVVVTASNSSGATVSKSISVTVDVELSLVWSDEFNTDGFPDPAKWGYDLGAGGWGNAEAQYYTNRKENASVSNGTLKITAMKENYSGSAYTSARLLTRDKYAFTFGKVEVKAKLPSGVGTWPAVWMLGSNIGLIGWPACGEIDIVEHIGREQNKIFGTLHYTGRSGGNANGSTKVIANASTEFHLYALEWTSNSIKISVDNQVYHSVFNSSALPFNRDFFIIMNLAMGGNFAGPIDPAFISATLEIDYIRVYR
ncbi:MAG: family 16 glycosylhydrolase [Bacteroidota bacterium]|nr:family 16 glycosylhydrolase [Bacteroidota bacterium]